MPLYHSGMEERLVDVLRGSSIVKMPEKEAREEGLLILTRPPVSSVSAPTSAKYTPPAKPVIQKNYRQQDVRSDLVPNFHWEIRRGRRLKGLSRVQLAMVLNVTEQDIAHIEQGHLPRNDFVVINALEKTLGIVLRTNPVADAPAVSSLTQAPSSSKPAPLLTRKSDATLAELQYLREQDVKKRESKDIFDKDFKVLE